MRSRQQLKIIKVNKIIAKKEKVVVVEDRMIERWKRHKEYSKKLVRGMPRHLYKTDKE
jgi:hypothetical protein